MVPTPEGVGMSEPIPELWWAIGLTGFCALFLVGHPFIMWGSARSQK